MAGPRVRRIALAAVAWMATAPGIARAAEPPLFPDPVLAAPARPTSMTGGDFNEDGHADLLVGGDDSPYLSIFLGQGDGTFEEHRIDNPYSGAAAVGDFDGDGHQDLVASSAGFTVEVRLGNGDGTFDVPILSDIGTDSARRIDVADINEDDRDDLLISFLRTNDGAILLGNGDGTFGSPLAGGYLSKVGDFDEDGHLDLVTPSGGSITVRLGNGDGTFSCCTYVPVPGGAYELLVDDLDGDGHADISGSSLGNSSDESVALWVIYGTGIGTFEGQTQYTVAPGTWSLSLADLDADGADDLIAGHLYMGQVSVLFGAAPRGFNAPVFIPTVNVQSGGPTVARDFDEDGSLDLAVASWNGYTLSVVHGYGDRTFRPIGRRDFEGGALFAVGDLDLDQHLDVVAAHADGLEVLPGDGAGNLGAPHVFTAGTVPSEVAIGHLDGDILPDLALLNLGSEDVSLLLGQGFGNFVLALQVPLDPAPWSLVWEDLNGDGLSDLATTHAAPLNAVVVRLNRGDGTFSAPRVHPVGDNPDDLAAGRLDGDEYLDLVTANSSSGDVSILRGEVGGSFGAEQRFPAGSGPRQLAIGDVNRDGHRDIVVSGPNVVLPGRGDGTFAPAIPLDLPAMGLTLTDFDDDGRLDIAGRSGSTVTVASSLGGFSFDTPGTYGTSGPSLSVKSGDFDEDGRPDLVTSGNRVSLHINRGPTTLSFARDGVTLGWPLDDDGASFEIYRGTVFSLVDSDQDGLPDDGYGTCLGETDPTHNEWTELDEPATDEGFFYLVSTVDPLGVRDLGTTSAGHTRQPSEICP